MFTAEFDPGIIVTIIAIVLGGINGLISHRNKKKKEAQAKQDASVAYSSSASDSDGNDDDGLFSFSTLSKIEDCFGLEPDPPHKNDVIVEPISPSISEPLAEAIAEVVVEADEVAQSVAQKIERDLESETERLLEIDNEIFDNISDNKPSFSLRDSLKSNPKLLILYSEILKPKYQDF